jgi:nucleoside-diphosphate-sugar epimerase
VRQYCRTAPEYRFDLVIHCAAVVGGRAVKESPVAHAVNLEIDAAFFQWVQRTQPRRTVYLSSVAAYPVAQAAKGKLKEEDIDLENPGLPDQLYGWAKLTGEILASRVTSPVSVVRPFCIYGNPEDTSHAFENFAMQVREKRNPITIWGSGNQARDYIHIGDVIRAILAVIDNEVNEPVNICTGVGTSLLDLVTMMSKAAGWPCFIELLPDKPEGLPYHVGSIEKLSKFYTPQVSIEQGTRQAVQL